MRGDTQALSPWRRGATDGNPDLHPTVISTSTKSIDRVCSAKPRANGLPSEKNETERKGKRKKKWKEFHRIAIRITHFYTFKTCVRFLDPFPFRAFEGSMANREKQVTSTCVRVCDRAQRLRLRLLSPFPNTPSAHFIFSIAAAVVSYLFSLMDPTCTMLPFFLGICSRRVIYMAGGDGRVVICVCAPVVANNNNNKQASPSSSSAGAGRSELAKSLGLVALGVGAGYALRYDAHI